MSTTIATIEQIQTLLGVTADGKFGTKSRAALESLLSAPDDAQWPPVAQGNRILTGDGSFPWTAEIDGDDIVIRNARATCFGGSDDPQDDGSTASGISTKANPELQACSLPMNYTGPDGPTRRALIGSPIPMLPWKTMVRVTPNAFQHPGTDDTPSYIDVPVIDLGPARDTGNAVDLTIAAARCFIPSATASDFELRCEVRILGGARYALQPS